MKSLHRENVKICIKRFSCNLVSYLLAYGPAATVHRSKEADDFQKQTEETTAVSPQPTDKLERQKVSDMISPHTTMCVDCILEIFSWHFSFKWFIQCNSS